jgi:thiosulfate/3-mercaptopyruvate sulfurtransferase
LLPRDLKLALAVWCSLCFVPQVNAQPLVDAAWLAARIGQPELVILDVRGPYSRQSRVDYLRGHIPGAIYSSYEKGGWRTTDAAGINGQLPAIEKLETMLGELGVDNRSHVVIITAGGRARDTASGTRIYWTLKVLGHESVSLLDGGMNAWLAAR